ncbi:MAG: 50S ribosomal protein L28 [Candidatus Omnitrophica bacterium 4484_213]|nr:MAG: 50S ribosomal protein L28 [Candidatus Omnitrophica bacterium 4484_213]
MSKICAICGKGPTVGNRIARRGLAKSKGGVGKKITGQNVRTVINGVPRTIKVCTKCIKAGKVKKI